MAINRIHCENYMLNGELEGGNRRSQQRIEDLNVIITKLKSVTQTFESQLEEKKREYDELQQRCKMLEQKLEQIQLVSEKTEAAGSIKDDKKVEKRIQADEMITGKGKEEEEKKEEERKTEETETTPPLMLHALNVAHNQPKKSFKPTQPVLSPTHQPVSPQPERVVQPVSHQPEKVVPRPKPRSKVPRPRPESAVLSPAPQPVSPQPVVLQQPTPQAELPSTTEHHRRSRCNSTPEGMDTYRLPTSQSATLPRQTVMETEESSPHQLQRPAGVQLQPAGMINELTQKLARRRRWEETEEKQ